MKNLSDNNSPFTKEQADLLNKLIKTLSANQLQWLAGYLTGILPINEQGKDSQIQQSQSVMQDKKLTILYGTETGNSASLAEVTKTAAENNGVQAILKNISDYKKSQLRKERDLVIITSTHGDGDPPEPTQEFYEYLHSDKAPELKSLRYSVLALGDSSYDNFCQTGRDYDARLNELGGQRFYTRVDCDVDFEDAANQWIEGVIDVLSKNIQENDRIPPESFISAQLSHGSPPNGIKYSRVNPYWSTVLENQLLNGRGSQKEVRHVELLIEDSSIKYEPGDSLGILPRNSTRVVNELINTLKLDPDERVMVKQDEMSLQKALEECYEITTISQTFLRRYAKLIQSKPLEDLLLEENKPKLKKYSAGRQIIDVVEDFPPQKITGSQFVSSLRKLSPRLYSIASGYNTNPGEVHLTVAAIRYKTKDRLREGVASTYIADQLPEGKQVPVYVQQNESFRLPRDSFTPIIMVGPGTGIAPFRAFVEERQYMEAKGKNWLFFGDQHFRTDFLYQLEWQKYLKSGVLNKMDVAFSRDENKKVYVQHRLWENRKEIYSWLEEGAHFYVCGDAERMAPDVHRTLIELIGSEGNYKPSQAEDYVKRLQQEKRYVKDVY